MKKTIRNKVGHEIMTLSFKWRWRPRLKKRLTEKWCWRPVVVAHWDNLHTIKYRDQAYDGQSFYVPMTVQVFWLGFTFAATTHKRKLGERRWIRYQDSHRAIIDEHMKKDAS